MDPSEFAKTFGVSSPQQTPEQTQNSAPQVDIPATLSAAQNLVGSMQQSQDAGAPPAPDQQATDPQAPIPHGSWADAFSRLPGILGDSAAEESQPAQAAAGGALKSVFETKDFLFGDTPREQQSPFRQSVEDDVDRLRAEHPLLNGLSAGIGQFTVAMMGLGKLGMVAKALPYVGEGVAAVEGIKGGSTALEAGKAALAGAIAFDPHEARLSNLIQDTPLANPFNAWLSAKPGDSAAMGRLKNAMESLGMDAAIIGTFTGGLKIWKYLKAGDTQAASRAVTDLQAEQTAHVAQEQQANAMQASQQATQGQEAQPPAGPEAVPQASEPGAGPTGTEPVATGVPEGVSPEVNPNATPEAAKAGQEAAQSADIPVDISSTPTAATEQAGVAKPQAFKPVTDFKPSETSSILDDLPVSLENAEKDWDAMEKNGGWAGTMEAGQKLSPDMGTFYDRFKTDTDVDHMIALAVSHKSEELAAKGFRGTLTDAKLQRQVNAFASLAGVDPAGLAGILQQAGEASRTLTAKMIVVGSLAAKTFQDASLMAMRLKLGDFSEFGSMEAMKQEISKRFSIATTFLKLTDDIRAQGGRTLRANRGKPFDPSLFEGVTGDRFYDLLAQAQGRPQELKRLADPSLYRKILDTVSYMRISSLVSGPKTQLINIMTNGYMLGARPMERILGSVPGALTGSDASKALIKENLRQYSYMGSALYDGFGEAVKAFTRNDGILKPHSSEAFGPNASWQVPGTQAFNASYFKPWDSVPNLMYNALSVPLSAAGVAPRLLGGVDELVKQITYRSKLAARANMEGTEQAVRAGLKGKAAKDYIKSYTATRLDNAFDAEGRGVDPEALREANIATFQQDLLPGTLGKNIQTLISNDKTQLIRLILPFVKTPTNVIRYGWKMTPGLNMLQEEYRQMLSGSLGQEAKSQAIGQMSMGALFMGAASYLGAQGMITGGGPSNQGLKSQLLATGWQPYSIVVQHDDGTKSYIPFNRYDPVGLPLGIIADIQDAIHIMGEDGENTPEISTAIGALGQSLAKQFTSRTYLLSLNQALDALQDPGKRGELFFGSLAQSMVPYSGATRQLSTDPYLRDARTIADKMTQAIPGQSESLPPRYNWLGQPVLNRQGLWSDDNGTLVDQETLRLGLEGGAVMSPPSPTWNKVDLRNITLTTGENAYVAYQRLAGKPGPNAKSLRDVVANMMRTSGYKRAPDGDLGTKGTKSWLLAGMVNKYREAASRRIRADKNVRDALLAAQRRVVDHYAHLKQTPQSQDGQGSGSVQNIIDGFGASSK
jgi:hypothetical protein